MSAATAAFPLPILYANNFSVAWASTTTLTVTSGQSRNSTNAVDILDTSSHTIDTAVNGANGLDTGTLGVSSWYYVFAIGSSLNAVPTASLLSLSPTAPTLPSNGYDTFTLIGVWPTNSSSLLIKGYVTGNGNSRELFYDDSIKVLNDGTSATLAAIVLSAAVPPIQNTPVYIQDEFTPATASNYVSYFPGDSTGTVGPRTPGSVAAQSNGSQHKVISRLVSGAANIKYINSAASCNVDVWVNGFQFFV